MGKQLEDSFFDTPEKPKAKIKARPAKKATVKPEPLAQPERKPVEFKARTNMRDYDMDEAIKLLHHEGMLSAISIQECQSILDAYYDRPALRVQVDEWRERNGKTDGKS